MTATTAGRRNPWHTVGVAFAGGDREAAHTVEEALTLSGSDFEVAKADLTAHVLTAEGVRNTPVDFKAATYRTDTGGILGVVGSDYGVVQNREVFGLLDSLVDESGATFNAAGSYKGGSKVFVSLQLPETVNVGGVDGVQHYIFATTSHDGTGSLKIQVTPTRIFCTNQLPSLMRGKGALNSISLRHTSNVRMQVQGVREALALTYKVEQEFAAEAERLFTQSVSEGEFDAIVRAYFPAPHRKDSDRGYQSALTRNAEARATARTLWNADHNSNVHGTAWGAFNVLSEYADYYAPVRGGVLGRAVKVTDGKTDGAKHKALEVVRSFA